MAMALRQRALLGRDLGQMEAAGVPVRTQLWFDSASAETTRRLGASLAQLLAPGDVVALTGELGAGKTCLVQGLARGLGVDVPVTSPTFMLQRTYRGRVRLVHLDVYRLDNLQDVMDLGDEAFAHDAVTVIEWGDTIAALLPDDRLDVELRHHDLVTDPVVASRGETVAPDADGAGHDVAHAGLSELSDTPRRITVTALGRWAERAAELGRLAGDPGAG